ncbi:MAG: L,D-transpeptidase family protein [Clostridiales bacterium]|nr:L,D-transpeptidase family protein [Candidatus Crickella caballi]
MKKIRKSLLICVAFMSMLVLCSCNPQLTLNPKYAYSSFELNLGEEISTNIGDYVNFDELTEEEADFVRDNTEILYDGEEMAGESFAETGDHTLTINYCGHKYRDYKIKITDNEPPTFLKCKDVYSFVGLDLDSTAVDMMFDARDNSGKCKLKIRKKDVNTDKEGEYTVKAVATDPSGNKAEAEAKIVIQKPRYGAPGTYVFVDVAKQTLTYFVDGKVKLETPVVTGNAYGHGTPKGTYRLNNKTRNQKLVGREDNGDEYESFVYYWMAFIGNSYGLHDATWRATFGGNIYQGNGSHGCVNMPIAKAGELYEMIEIGTPVIIY